MLTCFSFHRTGVFSIFGDDGNIMCSLFLGEQIASRFISCAGCVLWICGSWKAPVLRHFPLQAKHQNQILLYMLKYAKILWNMTYLQDIQIWPCRDARSVYRDLRTGLLTRRSEFEAVAKAWLGGGWSWEDAFVGVKKSEDGLLKHL